MQVFALLPMMVLVPLIPAYILFKFLASQGSVTSADGSAAKLLGLKIQLGGAFAGYFALLVVLLYAFKPYLTPPPARLVWTLQGQVVDDHQQPVPITGDNFALLPQQRPPISTNAAGGFLLDFIADPQNPGGVTFPVITVSYGDYLPKQVQLDSCAQATSKSGLNCDKENHVIHMAPISLTPVSAKAAAVKTSEAKPIEGTPTEYQNVGHAAMVAPPPGYAGDGISAAPKVAQ